MTATPPPAVPGTGVGDASAALAPGLLLVAVIAMASRFISDRYGGPVMLYALLIGIAFNFLTEEDRTAPGIDYSAKTILRFGVALLGTGLTLADIAALGWTTVALVATAVSATIVVGWAIGRLFRLDHDHAVLSASAVAICGVSAALAVAAVLPATTERRRNLALTVAGVTAMSTLAMVFYPVITQLLGFNAAAAGTFLGATIHDVAQVVGAGHMISDEVARSATLVKLMRMTLLVPAVFLIAWAFRGQRRGHGAERSPFPWFIVAYVSLVLVNSLGVLPAAATHAALELSSWCIVVAVAALGVRTSVRELVQVGPRPMGAMFVQTAFLAALVAASLALLALD